MKDEITIVDIAKAANVSISTVSRVLNGKSNVSPKTRQKVEQIIRESDYHPNILAKNLSTSHGNIIGIVIPDVRNPYYANIFVECEKYANEMGYFLLLCNFLNSPEMEKAYYDVLISQRVSAVIHLGGCVDELISDPVNVQYMNRLANHIPIVASGKMDGGDCYFVNFDNIYAVDQVMDYLLSLGHKRIAFVGGRGSVISTVQKRYRYLQLLEKNGLEYGDYYVAEGQTYDEEGGYRAMNQVLSRKDWPTAVIAVNDTSAIGVIKAIRERGLDIPEDISVVSFDDTYLTEVNEPELTSVNNNYDEFCKTLLQDVDFLLKGHPVPRNIEIKPRLVIRKSCCKVKNE